MFISRQKRLVQLIQLPLRRIRQPHHSLFSTPLLHPGDRCILLLVIKCPPIRPGGVGLAVGVVFVICFRLFVCNTLVRLGKSQFIFLGLLWLLSNLE